MIMIPTFDDQCMISAKFFTQEKDLYQKNFLYLMKVKLFQMPGYKFRAWHQKGDFR